jgi:hypothetical protein
MNRLVLFALATLIGFGLLTLYHTGCFSDYVSAQSGCCNPPTYPLSRNKRGHACDIAMNFGRTAQALKKERRNAGVTPFFF